MKRELTAERLRELLHYDPETGVWTWLVRTSYRIKVGDPVGTDNGHGYIRTSIDGNRYLLHRLAWLWTTGEWPTSMIDHVNGVRNDNRWVNLRLVSNAENGQNRRTARGGGRSGLLGVSPHQGKYTSQIHVAGRKIHIGVFDTPEQAHEAYLAAKRRLHPGCTI